MHLARRIARRPSLWAFPLIASTFLGGCQATPRADGGSKGSTVTLSSRGSTPSRPFTKDELVGTWALTDARNSTFNILLGSDGHAVSTWSGGPTGAIGERGSWRLVDGAAIIEWTNGWIDRLAYGAHGVDQEAWGPGDATDAPPRTYGKAVPIKDVMTEFVGVWQTRGVLPGDPATVYVAIQSDGMIFKSIGDWRYGCWAAVTATGNRQVARMTWANGWYDELTRDSEGYLVRTWTPSADRSGQPSATNRVRRVD